VLTRKLLALCVSPPVFRYREVGFWEVCQCDCRSITNKYDVPGKVNASGGANVSGRFQAMQRSFASESAEKKTVSEMKSVDFLSGERCGTARPNGAARV